jgi:hypothetical protein
MHHRRTAVSSFLLLGAACFAGLVRAASAQEAECRASVSQEEHPLAHRAETISSLEQMPDSCLKALVVECNDTADARLLDLGSAALCSMGYEALLNNGFGGNFRAMMTWWQRDRDSRLVP